MSTLDQIRAGLTRAWDTITEGWRELREVAAEALTRFHPTGSDGAEDSSPAPRSARWGLLAAEVTDDENNVIVRLEAPGMDPADFDLQVVGDVLVVSGEKRVSRESQQGQYFVSERAYGRFERAVQLPTSVIDDQAKARYEAGVLTVRLPKTAVPKRSRISIEVD